MSRSNLKPDVWGPHGWFFLDSIVLSYPEKPSAPDRSRFKSFFRALAHVLPCERCRVHFRRHVKDDAAIDRALGSRTALSVWLLEARNKIRQRNKQTPIEFKSWQAYYQRRYGDAGCDDSSCSVKPEAGSRGVTLGGCCLVVVVLAITYLLFRLRQLGAAARPAARAGAA